MLIKLHPDDNVATAGADGQGVRAGHKAAVRLIRQGEPVIKGGVAIGVALIDIAEGHLADGTSIGALAEGLSWIPSDKPPIDAKPAFFEGIVRADGRVATRNMLGVLVVGNCAATVARQTADWFDEERLADFPNVDGVVAFVHEIGCGMEMTGEPMDLLRRTIAGFIRHPNMAGAVVLALGCERNNLKIFLEQQQLTLGDRLHALTMQENGGTLRTAEEARRLISSMLPEANKARRQTVSAAHLTVGLQSSAIDGFTGISANPALGVAVDLLTAQGGTAILSETPDLIPIADHLVARAADAETAERLKERLSWWSETYARGCDVERDGRLNPASAAAGLATVREKALDSLAKAGTARISGVRRYAEEVTAKGLTFMDTPSYDPIAVTGQIAGGANLIAFTTGRGDAFGSYPAPTFTIASNNEAYLRTGGDVDLNAGEVIDGEATVEALGRRIFDRLLAHASGVKTRSEEEGMGENEFAPWPIGVLN